MQTNTKADSSPGPSLLWWIPQELHIPCQIHQNEMKQNSQYYINVLQQSGIQEMQWWLKKSMKTTTYVILHLKQTEKRKKKIEFL